MISKEEAEKIVDRFAARLVATLGFKRIEDQRFGRQENDANAQLSFPWSVSPYGFGVFTAWVGLRFESLAQWIGEDEGLIMAPTTVIPIHLLREDKKIIEWKFTDIKDIEEQREEILGDLKKYALPFVNHYSQLIEFRKSLESPSKQDWFALGVNVDTRITILAAIQMIEGDKTTALKILDNALIERKDMHGKRRLDIEHLRKRILQNN